MAQSSFSMTQHGRSEPFELQVSRGQIPYHTAVSVFGYQSSVGTGTPVTVWENATEYVFPSSAAYLTIVSTSASDTSALSVLINGLDANFNLLSETIALNGTTAVTSVNSYFRVNSVICTNGNNVGTITFKQSTNIVAQINATVGKSQNAWYTVPTGYTLYIRRVDVFSNEAGGGSNYSSFRVQVNNRATGASFILLQASFSPTYTVDRVVPFGYTQQNDVRWQVSTGTGTSAIGVIVQAILIANDGTSLGY
jgi:hypothetical protein